MLDTNAVIVLSGGSKGLGKTCVSHFIKQGCRVATYSRTATSFISETLLTAKDQFYWEPVDVVDHQQVKKFCHNVYKKFGRIDNVINNAGIANEGILTLMTEDSINNLISINLNGVIQLTRCCTKYLLLKRGGAIVNISSINGIQGHAGLSVYGATKAALDGFSRGLAKELGPRGIRVNSIAPGYLHTEMTQHFSELQKARIIKRTPLGRLGKAEDIVGMIEFLLSSQASFITGQTFIIDGGLTC